MGSIRFAIVVLILVGITTAKDIFRYEEDGQSHYMTGEAGKAVEGGWTFNTDGEEFALTYKADEGGFQPQADHIPVAVVETKVPVEKTNEVLEAEAKFYALFKEAKMRAEEGAEAAEASEVVKEIRKREAFHKMPAALHDKYTYHPHFGYVPADAREGEDVEEMKAKVYQYIPYKGFVATDEEDAEKPLFKFVPYRGFIPVKAAEESEDAKLFNFHPYYGYVPNDEELAEKPQFKFHPWHGFVPVGPDVETPEDKEFKYVPYRGFVPVDEADDKIHEADDKIHPYFKKLQSMRYKFVPYQGFMPKLDEEVERKKRETAEEETTETKLSYQFHPYFGLVPEHDPELVKSMEDQEYKYVPYFGFVPHTDEDEEDVKTYKFNPFYGFVDAEAKPEEAEMKDTLYKFVPYYGFVPVNKVEQDDEKTKDQMVFHPYYGYMPRLISDAQDKADQEEQLYKLDPVRGFVPEPSEEATRKKREAQFVTYAPYPVYHHPYYYPSYGFGINYLVPKLVPAVVTQPAKPAAGLSDDFPVIPNEDGQNEPGAVEF